MKFYDRQNLTILEHVLEDSGQKQTAEHPCESTIIDKEMVDL